MCGIIGFVDKKNKLSKQKRVKMMEMMLKEIRYRGYDSTGIYQNEMVTMGHNRLSILDKSKKANQPLISQSKKLVISYNGEIYNHLDLRDYVGNQKYLTKSDTESLLTGYEVAEDDIFIKAKGMFAVSILDIERKKIILTVDDFGIKPLYYIDTEDWFAWTSEIKTFKYLEGFKFAINENYLFEQATFRTLYGDRTVLENIKKVEPKQIIKFDLNKNEISNKSFLQNDDFEKGDTEKLLIDSIIEHTLSDVPIGFQLSGGIDSSLISTIAKKHLNQRIVHSFSIGLKDDKWNEFKYSRQVSKKIGTCHHEIKFSEKDFCKSLPISTYHMDEPVSYPNTVPIMILSKKARKYVKVLLSGEGSDEIFCGYNRHKKIIENNKSEEILFSNSFMEEKDFSTLFKIAKTNLKDRSELITNKRTVTQNISYYDIKTFLPSLLLRQDKMGMANNLENRFPFLDTTLVSNVLNLPDTYKYNEGETKYILKKLSKKYLDENIIYRKKCGFGLPIKYWMLNENGFGKYFNLFKNPTKKRVYLNYKNINQYIDEHIKGLKDHSEPLWILICLEVWAKIFIDGEKAHNIWKKL